MENKIIEVSVPIKIEFLKQYFSDKESFFMIDYDKSSLQEDKFLTYLSNLDLPCDIKFDKTNEKHVSLLLSYITSKNLVSLPSLEKEAVKVFLEMKQKGEYGYSVFIENNKVILEKTLKLLESLTLYNFYTIKNEESQKQYESFENKSCDDLGVNFVNWIKYTDFTLIYENVDFNSLFFYKEFFKEYVFKGKNLYYYWANNNNPLFLLTWGIMNRVPVRSPEQLEELNVTSV